MNCYHTRHLYKNTAHFFNNVYLTHYYNKLYNLKSRVVVYHRTAIEHMNTVDDCLPHTSINKYYCQHRLFNQWLWSQPDLRTTFVKLITN
uniref:Uncharacterized protein n=1 Tax=Octopus bimaculoides TaxID=37653 RepID=A0A0L8H7Q3_OCTBM